MDLQILFNIVIGAAGTLGGFILNAIWNSLKDLQNTDKELSDKVGRIEVLIAGEYVKQDRFENALKNVSAKLDQIMEKLDSKADKAYS